MLKKSTTLGLAIALFIGLSINNIYIEENFDRSEAASIKFVICLFQFATFLVRI